jgi:hypothetical protein
MNFNTFMITLCWCIAAIMYLDMRKAIDSCQVPNTQVKICYDSIGYNISIDSLSINTPLVHPIIYIEK